MRQSFANLRKILIEAVLAALLALPFLFGCKGGSSSSGDGLTPEFFNREIKGEITVCAYDSMLYRNYLEEAVRLFEERYPGTKVNIETFSAMPEIRTSEQGNMFMTIVQAQDDPQSRADYLNRVNTNIMSGTGADVYAMDIIPIHKFTESGTLENLEPYINMDAGFNKEDYRQNILESLHYKDGIWFLPMDYTFNYFSYDSTLVPFDLAASFGADKAWSVEELFRLGMPLYDGMNKLFNTADYNRMGGGMFRRLLNENILSFVNLETKRANFTDGGFIKLLESVKRYGEEGYIPQTVSGQQDAVQLMQRAAAPTDRFFFKLDISMSLITQFGRSSGIMMRMAAGNVPSVDDDDEIAGIEAMTDGSVPFTFNQGFGINSRSKNKALAWAFLKFLLSDEMQLSTNLSSMGLPVHNKTREEKAELTFSGAFMGRGGVTLNDQQRRSLEDYKAAVEKLSDNINTFVVQDASVNDMISNEVQFYFDGSRTAQEAARVLHNKVDLYLSE